MTASSTQTSVCPEYVLEQPLPHIKPLEGLDTPVLGDAMRKMDTTSMAEFILSLHHEYNKVKVDGLPLGPVEQEIFDFYWTKMEQHKFQAILLPLYTDIIVENPDADEDDQDVTEKAVFATLHSDQSVLVWQKVESDSYAPVPQPFYLDLSEADRLALYPSDTFRLGTLSHGIDLPAFIEQSDYINNKKEPVSFAGDISLKEALSVEARQWIDWLPSALPVLPSYSDVSRSPREILYPWLHHLKVITDEQRETLDAFLRDFLAAMAIQEGLAADASSTDLTGGVSIMGRYLDREGNLQNPSAFLGWGDATEGRETTGVWEECLISILNHADFPVPPIAQLMFNPYIRTIEPDSSLELYVKASLTWTSHDVDTGMSAHERMDTLSRVTRFGIPIPAKGTAFKELSTTAL